MKDLLKQWGKHVVALILFLGLVMTYFSPAVFDGKVIMQGDNIKATGMGSSQMDQYAETAQPGEFSVWSDAMFGGMPYVTGYGQAAPSMPSYSIVDGWLKKVGYGDAAMVFVGLVCFYLLMCVMGVNWWLAVAGACVCSSGKRKRPATAPISILQAVVLAFLIPINRGSLLTNKKGKLIVKSDHYGK